VAKIQININQMSKFVEGIIKNLENEISIDSSIRYGLKNVSKFARNYASLLHLQKVIK